MAKDGGVLGWKKPKGPGWWQASDGLWYPPSAEQLAALPPPPALQKGFTRGQRVFVAVVFTGLAVVLLSALFFDPSGRPPSEPKATKVTDAMADAWYGCTTAVTNRLKAPATADFPRYSQVSVVATAGRFEVTSYVDSENGFGANIRTPFSCTGTYREATNDWLFTTSLD